MQKSSLHFSFKILTVVLLGSLLNACTTTSPAPVIERATSANAPTAKKTTTNAWEKDWRPGTHTVKRGDTLYSIGLEYGYDYKEIAQLNQIQSPYTIYIGQQLRLPSTSAQTTSKGTSDGDVVTRPLGSTGSMIITQPTAESTNTPTATTSSVPQATAPSSTTVAGATTVITEPRALKEPYSVQALATPTPAAPSATVASNQSATPAQTVKPAATPQTGTTPVASNQNTPATPPDNAAKETPKPATATTAGDDESINWGWPASGKVIAGFSDTANGRGIDIGGTQGQAVIAAAPGKVIYSGSDLRGYGKLVIIKHNNTYLSVYAHNSQILVKEGQQVTKGQKIAEMGSSDTDKVKLHFEIRRQGKSVDPASYLPSIGN